MEEWSADGISKLNNIGPSNKLAARSDEQVFHALSEKTLFTLDPRVGKQEKVAQKLNYAKNPYMTCMGSTQNGNVAVGTRLGEIKLFTDVGKRAKTSLPGLGDPISSIDVTKAGDWVLATCNGYLIITPTVSHGVNGFVKSLGAKKRVPHKLELKPRDLVKYGIREVKFTPARFNVAENETETAIITSVDNFLVIWDFERIKRGNYGTYMIKPMGERIIKNEFRFGMDDTIITHPQTLEFQRNKVRFHRR